MTITSLFVAATGNYENWEVSLKKARFTNLVLGIKFLVKTIKTLGLSVLILIENILVLEKQKNIKCSYFLRIHAVLTIH